MAKRSDREAPAQGVLEGLGATADPLGERSDEESRGTPRGGLETLWKRFRERVAEQTRARELAERYRAAAVPRPREDDEP
jgi:protoporphyrinogen oxidase